MWDVNDIGERRDSDYSEVSSLCDWEESNAINTKKIQKEGNVVGRVMSHKLSMS